MPRKPADVKRVRFVPVTAVGEKVRSHFTRPRPMVAVEDEVTVDWSALSQLAPETFDELYVFHLPLSTPGEMQKVDLWLAVPDNPDDPGTVVIELESGTIRWRPGRAVIQCAEAKYESIFSALIDFAFFEGELRRMEQDLLPYESSAIADVDFAYRIRRSSRQHWDRFGRTMEDLARLRLSFTVIEPHLTTVSRRLDTEGRKVAARLIGRSRMAPRLESFSNRLEACEDLYEGAVDRITDFSAYEKGLVLERIIVVLLLLELAAMVLASVQRL